jgi:hypothetical protein
LNTYKEILERKYGLKVRDLFLVKLHPENRSGDYEVINCADLSSEVKELFSLQEAKVRKSAMGGSKSKITNYFSKQKKPVLKKLKEEEEETAEV